MSQIPMASSLMYEYQTELDAAQVQEVNPSSGIRGPLLSIVFVCAGLISYWGNMAIATQAAIVSQAVVCLLGVVILGYMFAHRTPVVFTSECLLIAAFFAWSLVGYIFAIQPVVASQGLVTLFKLLLMALAVANAVNGRRAFLWLLVGVILASLVGALAGGTGIARGADEVVGGGGRVIRMQGAFGNPNGLSKLSCLCIWACASLMFISRRQVVRLVMIGIILFSVVIVGYTGSRQAMVALFLMICATWWFILRKTSKRATSKAVWLVVIGFILGGAVLYMTTTAHWRRMEVVMKGGVGSEASLDARASFMKTSLRAIGERPLFGLGFDCVRFYIGGYQMHSPHNTVVGLAANTGIPGWLFFFGAWGLFLWRLRRVSKLPLPQTDLTLVLCIWLSQACLLLWSGTTTLLNYKPLFVVAPVCLGYLVWLERTYGQERLTYDQAYR